MLSRLVSATGVDAQQWRALVRAYVMLDYSALLGAYGPIAARRAAWHLVLQIFAFTMFGAFPVLVILLAPDTWLAATVMVTVTSMLVATFVLMQARMLIAPDDYAIVGCRPVTSRTYFAARLGGLLANTVEVAVLSGWPSVLAFLVAASFAAAIAAAAALLASAAATALAVAATYTWLLRRVRPAKLDRAVTITAVLGLMAALSPQLALFVWLGDSVIDDTPFTARFDVALPRETWTLAYPGAWFGAFVEAARGGASRIAWSGVALAFGCLAALGAAIRGRLSGDYAVRLGEVVARADARVTAAGPAWSWLANERRAVAVLVWSALRSDTSIQASAAVGVVLASIMVGFDLASKTPEDPFFRAGRSITPGFAMLTIWPWMIVSSLRNSIVVSQQAAASWILVATPADRRALVDGLRDILVVFVLLPTLVVMAGVFTWAYGHVGHALLKTAFLGLVVGLVLQTEICISPALPFSVPAIQPRAGLPAGLGRFVLPALALPPIDLLLSHFAYGHWTGVIIGLALLAGGLFLLVRLTHARIRRGAGVVVL